ncbi:MAG: M15 family metallopeptidase [Bacteroidales bacterium]|nr:M15 family metallopeptidase [Bacteroidales bacterium]
MSDDKSGFCYVTDSIPDVILEIRYYSNYNFVGRRIDGYERPVAMLTHEAASALKSACRQAMELGYTFKVFDAYRPQCAVDVFVEWAADEADTLTRSYFYPYLSKSRLIPGGYIATKSGHTRGSTVDLTLFELASGKEVDMGAPFDWFGEESSPAYPVGGKPGLKPLTEEQHRMRMLLRKIMTDNGFRSITSEWWHFTLKDEPYPDTYFSFPLR